MNLKWDDKKRDLVISKLVHGDKNIDAGSACMFVPLSKRTGVKLYNCPKTRDFAFYAQKNLPKISSLIAPKVGVRFSFYICYHSHKNEWSVYQNKFWGYTTERANLVRYIPEKILCEIEKELKLCTPYDSWDLHYRNIGYIGNYYVVLDYDPLTLLGETL